jgi:hypothetical protein
MIPERGANPDRYAALNAIHDPGERIAKVPDHVRDSAVRVGERRAP